ncbi:MAG TPA: AraC family transcriptional regulator [Kiritimatiellia bacterium]|nr:AraC family transcriptional regulator [Kiritimatiellia bacterium]
MIKVREGFHAQRLLRMPLDAVRRAKSSVLMRDFHITDLGHFPESRHHWVSRPEGHPQIILIYCVAGEGWVQCGRGRRTRVPADHVVALPAGVPHQYGASAQAPWNIYWAHIGGRRAEEFVRRLRGTPPRTVQPVAADERIAQAFEDAWGALGQGATDAGMLLGATALAHMLALLLAARRAHGRKSRDTEARVGRSVAWMRAHLAEPLRLADLARAAGLSVPHYCALFRQQVGRAPMRSLNDMRMQRAAHLLDATREPIAAIAAAVGYPNPFHFSRNFKTYIGVSPRRYRASIKG